MSNSVEDLRKRYQRMEAPPYLATRILGHVGDEPSKRRWLPAVATLGVVAFVMAVVPRFTQQPPDAVSEQATISFATLSRMTPTKPAMTSPPLSQLKSIKTPVMPARPSMQPAEEPQSRRQNLISDSKELKNA